MCVLYMLALSILFPLLSSTTIIVQPRFGLGNWFSFVTNIYGMHNSSQHLAKTGTILRGDYYNSIGSAPLTRNAAQKIGKSVEYAFLSRTYCDVHTWVLSRVLRSFSCRTEQAVMIILCRLFSSDAISCSHCDVVAYHAVINADCGTRGGYACFSQYGDS